MTEKTPEEIAGNLLANEEIVNVPTVIYKIDVEKLKEYGYEGVADILNSLFGTLAIDASDDGTIERMFLDSELGQYHPEMTRKLTFFIRNDEEVDMKKQWKICNNPDCRKKFYREERHTKPQWDRVLFHGRKCQVRHRDENVAGKGPPKYKHKNSYNIQELNDSCNRYISKARQRLKDEVVVYSSKNMSQEELQALVTSMEG